MVNQICIAGLVQGLSEGLNFALRAGLDAKLVLSVISKGAGTILANGESRRNDGDGISSGENRVPEKRARTANRGGAKARAINL